MVADGRTVVVVGVVAVEVTVVEVVESAAALRSDATAASQEAANRVGACPLAVAGTDP